MTKRKTKGLRFQQLAAQNASTNLFGMPGEPNLFGLDHQGRVWRLVQLKNGGDGWASVTDHVALEEEVHGQGQKRAPIAKELTGNPRRHLRVVHSREN
jgi:hypothetical protein